MGPAASGILMKLVVNLLLGVNLRRQSRSESTFAHARCAAGCFIQDDHQSITRRPRDNNDPQHTQETSFDRGGVFSAVKPETIVLEMSTISPELSQLLHQEASKRGAHLIDLAVSGSTPAVEAGNITLLAGGDQNTFDRCIPIYESIAKQWFLMGPAASGILMKLVVNLLLGVTMQAIAEAVSLGEHLRSCGVCCWMFYPRRPSCPQHCSENSRRSRATTTPHSFRCA